MAQRSASLLLLLLIMGGLALSGCSKKVTKTAVQEPVAKAVTPEAPPAPPRETFETVDPAQQVRDVLQTVYFDYDKYALRTETLDRLGQIGKMLQEQSSVKLLMEGHADERGTAEYNMALGEHRARAVRDWLVSYGIADSRLEITSYGKERPADPNCGDNDDACHAKNRRVEFKALSK